MMVAATKEEAELMKKFREAKTEEEEKKILEEMKKVKKGIDFQGPICWN